MSGLALAVAGGSAALVVVKALVLVLGAIITFYATRAYVRTRHRPLGLMAGGFGLVTLGLAVAGVTHQVLEVSLATGILLESVLALLGFLVIALSLFDRPAVAS